MSTGISGFCAAQNTVITRSIATLKALISFLLSTSVEMFPFATETEVVWDVDLLGNDIIMRKYVTPDRNAPAAVFRYNNMADTEPAVPGFTMPVADLFEP